MGREIRRVPPNWEHPRHTQKDAPSREHVGEYRSCYDYDYESASDEWERAFDLWRRGEHPSQADYRFWEYDQPPDKETCRPAFCAEPTWYQVYQTVTEGYPVSPPFPTPEELASYLAKHGDFWAQDEAKNDGRPVQPPSYEQALAFVLSGHAPSFVVSVPGDGCAVSVKDAYEQEYNER